jgi:hypothetical protein
MPRIDGSPGGATVARGDSADALRYRLIRRPIVACSGCSARETGAPTSVLTRAGSRDSRHCWRRLDQESWFEHRAHVGRRSRRRRPSPRSERHAGSRCPTRQVSGNPDLSHSRLTTVVLLDRLACSRGGPVEPAGQRDTVSEPRACCGRGRARGSRGCSRSAHGRSNGRRRTPPRSSDGRTGHHGGYRSRRATRRAGRTGRHAYTAAPRRAKKCLASPS